MGAASHPEMPQSDSSPPNVFQTYPFGLPSCTSVGRRIKSQGRQTDATVGSLSKALYPKMLLQGCWTPVSHASRPPCQQDGVGETSHGTVTLAILKNAITARGDTGAGGSCTLIMGWKGDYT